MKWNTCTTKTITLCWKKLKKTQTNGKTSHVHESEELILLNCPFYPKPSIDSTQSLSKFQWHSLQEKGKTILKWVWNHKRHWIPKQSWEKTKLEIILMDLKLYYEAIIIKTVWYLHKNRHTY